ncbi:MAG: RNA methyltransferase [Polyangiaceae bacterium]|nr:RNA methyltransferase [Polyangiaceae bacterium]
MRALAVVLLHHPVVDREGAVVTTAITNLDLHDIARSAHAFGAQRLYVAHPVAAQRELATRIRDHWVDGSGGRRIPDRRPAMAALCVVESLDAAVTAHGGAARPELWTTSAAGGRAEARRLSHEAARAELEREGPPVLLALGTGWGLAPAVLERADAHLEPIRSPRADGWNHLSVRAAAAILLDRLAGPRAGGERG